jgi:hypothetical protein
MTDFETGFCIGALVGPWIELGALGLLYLGWVVWRRWYL